MAETNATLTCLFSYFSLGPERLNITWFHDGKMVGEGRELTIPAVLPTVQTGMSREYICSAILDSSRTVASVKLIITSPPVFIPGQEMTYLTVVENKDAVFRCGTSSYGTAQDSPVWYVNTDAVADVPKCVTRREYVKEWISDKIKRFVISADRTMLTIHDVSLFDRKCVQCSVKNQYGMTFGTGCLTAISGCLKQGESKTDCNNCTEINECISYENLCPTYSKCVNTIGSYRCECHDGYTLFNGACKDVDECDLAKSRNTSVCGKNSKCQNKVGMFECVCCNGFQDDGNGTCVKIAGEEEAENGTRCCICEMSICERQGPVCGVDFIVYDSVKDLIISNCEKGLSSEWYEAVDYYGYCKVSCPNTSLCPKYQECVKDDKTGLPTCQCERCTEEEITSEKVCTDNLDVYKNLCEFKQMQCLLDQEAVPLPTFKPCEGKNGGSGPVGDWGPWGPCSVTCGKGKSVRSRLAYRKLSVPEQVKYPLSLPTECYDDPCPESNCFGHICGYIFAECVKNDAGNPVCECPTCTNIGHEPVCGFVQLSIGRIATRVHRSACHLKKLACENNYHDAGVINDGHCGVTPVHCTRVPEYVQYVREGPNNTYVSDRKLQGYGCLGGCYTLKHDCCRPVATETVAVKLFNRSDRSQPMTIQVEMVKDCDCVELDDIEGS